MTPYSHLYWSQNSTSCVSVIFLWLIIIRWPSCCISHVYAFYFSLSAIYIISRGLVTLNDYCMYYLNKNQMRNIYHNILEQICVGCIMESHHICLNKIRKQFTLKTIWIYLLGHCYIFLVDKYILWNNLMEKIRSKSDFRISSGLIHINKVPHSGAIWLFNITGNINEVWSIGCAYFKYLYNTHVLAAFYYTEQ